jgi:FKBP-type peptidyl-prolyl cis-trans isomerase 2
MKSGDFINIDYIGTVKSSGEKFDFTIPKIAKEAGDTREVGPVTIVIGAGHLIPGLDEEIRKHKVGDEFEINIPAEKAFGKRSPKLMQLIPRSKFKRDQLNPIPGMRVTINGLPGIIRSSSGGRVIVDFNHPLAGKELHYWVKINKNVTVKKEKVKSLMEYYGFKDVKFKLTESDLIVLNDKISQRNQALLSQQLKTHIKIKNVKFKAEKSVKSSKNQTKSK